MCGLFGANEAASGMENQPVDGGVVAGCAPACATDFTLAAPCAIVKASGGQVTLTASEIDGFSGGTFTWTTSSTKVRLSSATGSSVTAEGLADVSSGRDAEIVQVVRSSDGCPDITKTVSLTVAKVTFSADPSQRYGYDNNDTPDNHDDDHLSIKQSDYTTVHVTIEGGALGTDFDFVCDTADLCTAVAPAAAAAFDLRLNAGSTSKSHALLKAKGKCPAAPEFARINVCVYKEKVVDVVVAKMDHTVVANRSLHFPTADYASFQDTFNGKLKEGVVRYNVSNYRPDNGITPIAFVSGTGVLTYDIKANGGADLDAIKAAITGAGSKVRVAVIADMVSVYYLSAAAAVGDTSLVVTAATTFYHVGDSVPVGTGASRETVRLTAIAGNTLTCTPLTKAHAAGETIEFPAVGWGGGDPILVAESSDALNVLKWTIVHEVGHTALVLEDIDTDTTTIMYYNRGRTDYRLRYCPRTTRYHGTPPQNQWETIPRT